ncbi:unnamed protein product [Closterium sp. NIES-54]
MMEKFFSFMSFYEQHQQAAPAQSNNSDNNNGVTPMSLDGSPFARGNQQPSFAPYKPQRGSVSVLSGAPLEPFSEPSEESPKKIAEVKGTRAGGAGAGGAGAGDPRVKLICYSLVGCSGLDHMGRISALVEVATEAAEAVEAVAAMAVEGVGVVVGVVPGVEVSAAAVEAEEAVAVAEGAEVAAVAEVAEAAEAAVELVAALRRGVAPVAVRASSSSAVVRPLGASGSFFRDRTTLTLLSRLVAVSLADPSGGPVLASFSTVLPCPAAPSGTLSGLYLPSFSTNLVSGTDLQDQGVDQFSPASQRVTHCTCARTGRHLATFTRRPGSSLYTLSTESPPVPASGQVAASSQVFAATSGSGPESAPCSCRLLSHQTLLWHHRLGHPSLPRLRGMASRVLVSVLPRSLPPLPPRPAPTCVPCVEGRKRAAPHSSEFPPTEAPLQTLHMDVWGPARVRGQGHERYFLLVVDDYSRYTTVFPLRSKDDVTEVLIDWIRAARLQLRESFGSDFLVLRLHSDRGGEFSSARLGAFCRAQGIRQTFTLPASPQ